MPATMPPAGPAVDDHESENRDRHPSERRRLIWLGGAVATIVGGALVLWLNAGDDPTPLSKRDVPLVKAAETPAKVRPEDPGGMDVAHRDKLIYQRFERNEATPVVERLLSAPEEPLPPPRSEPEPAQPSGVDAADEARPTEFEAAPPDETALANSFKEFLNDTEQPAPLAAEAPLTSSHPSSFVAMAPPSPRPGMPPRSRPESEPESGPKSAPKSGLSAEARAAESLLMGARAENFAIQLGSVRSRQEASVEWERLKRSHADILGGLQLTVLEADLGNRGTYYRLRAGPITSQGSARHLCSSLVDRKVACIVVQP
jgi:SPOR domain